MAISLINDDMSDIYTEEYNKNGREVYDSIGESIDDSYRPRKRYRQLVHYTDDGDVVFNVFQDNTPKDTQVNYNKKFQAEMQMLRKILKEHQRLMKDAKKNFYATTGIGSNNIKDQRSLSEDEVAYLSALTSGGNYSLALIKAMSDVKKSAADLNMKQKKLLYDLNGLGGDEDMSQSQFGSNILADILAKGNVASASASVPIMEIPDLDGNDINLDNLSINNNIKYEGKDVMVVAIHDQTSGDNYLQAIDSITGDKIDDYSLPPSDKLNVNLVDHKAYDKFGRPYPLIIQ